MNWVVIWHFVDLTFVASHLLQIYALYVIIIKMRSIIPLAAVLKYIFCWKLFSSILLENSRSRKFSEDKLHQLIMENWNRRKW